MSVFAACPGPLPPGIKETYTANELLGLPEMPTKGTRSITRRCDPRHGTLVAVPGSNPFQIYFRSLPETTRAALVARAAVATLEPDAAPAAAPSAGAGCRRATAEGLTPAQQRQLDDELLLWSIWQRERRAGPRVKDQSFYWFAERWNADDVEAPADLRQRVPKLSRSTLWRMNAAYARGTPESRVDRRQGPKIKCLIEADAELFDLAVHLIKRSRLTSSQHIDDAFQARFPGRRLPSLRRIQAFKQRYLAEHRRECEQAWNPDAAKGKYRPAFGDTAEDVRALNQLWELDSTSADVMCTDGRMTVLGGIDVYSGWPRFLVAPTSKAVNVGRLFRRMAVGDGERLRPMHLPFAVRVDRGSDYISKHFRRICTEQEVALEILTGDTPEGKPRIERAFGTLTRRLFRTLPGFVGHSVADAQEIRSARSHAERRGKNDRQLYGVALDSAELQRRIDDFAEHVLVHEPQKRFAGLTPFQMVAGWRLPLRKVPDLRALDFLLDPAPGGRGDGWYSVGKKGVQTPAGTFVHADLARYVNNARVQCFPLDDRPGFAAIYGERRRFVCIAEDPAITGASRREIAVEAVIAWRHDLKHGRAEDRERAKRVDAGRIHDDVAADRAARAEKIVRLPARTVDHWTDAMRGAADAAAAAGAAEAAEVARGRHDPERLAHLVAEQRRMEAEIAEELRRSEAEERARLEAAAGQIDWA